MNVKAYLIFYTLYSINKYLLFHHYPCMMIDIKRFFNFLRGLSIMSGYVIDFSNFDIECTEGRNQSKQLQDAERELLAVRQGDENEFFEVKGVILW